MAVIVRGEKRKGKRHKAPVIVKDPPIDSYHNEYLVENDVEIECSVADRQPVTISLSHDEALVLCADLARRLAMRIDPPKPPPLPPRKRSRFERPL